MSDFMKWLYAHYIRPQLDAAPPDDYEMPLSPLRWRRLTKRPGNSPPSMPFC